MTEGIYVELVNGKIANEFGVQQNPPVTFWPYDSPEYIAYSLGKGKKAKLADVEREYNARLAMGFAFTHGGQPKQANLSVQGVQIIMAIYALGCGTVLNDPGLLSSLSLPPVTWPGPNVPYRTDDGTYVVLTRPEAFALAVGAFNRVAAIRFRRGMLDIAVLDAGDQAALAAIDITTGWPSQD